MNIRSLSEDDDFILRKIHQKFYRDEFNFPDLKKFIFKYVITDNNDQIITAGGIKILAEGILLTDKARSPRERLEALYEAMDLNRAFCQNANIEQLHVFIQDPSY